MITDNKLSRIFQRILEENRVITDEALCYTLGTDASFYRLTPKIILKINSLNELVDSLKICNQYQLGYTFRAAGTSLSGQAISDSVLMMFTENWNKHEILNDGKQIKLECGIIGADANRFLVPFARKIGPDPASINSCKIGGIAANNASGMCCGTAHNSYQTLTTMKLVLFDGTILDTSDQQSINTFRQTHSKFLQRLLKLATTTRENKELAQLIQHKYRLKNTTGYSINALIDFEDPIEILQHLMIGSEGSLGFIAEITYNTIAEYPHKATALYIFENIEIACNVVSELSNVEISAVELMDGRALRSIRGKPGLPSFVDSLDIECSALLLEVEAETSSKLNSAVTSILNIIKKFQVEHYIEFSHDKKLSSQLWDIRKGLFPAVGANRVKGTTVIIEDIAFPVQQLAIATRDLQKLLISHGYSEAIIFGHALAGNLHFVFTQDFSIDSEIQQYKSFMLAITELVTSKYKGSLKAEHGTGRNMAPFVELEWGAEAYRLMTQIKQLFDPDGLINPGVIINSNQDIHLENLKTLPIADDLIDECIECGFCEPVCPSKSLTLTPRQRIVMYRQIQQLNSENKQQIARKLTKQFDYLGINSCAATGLCKIACPVGINTGDLILKLRQQKHHNSSWLVNWTKKHFSFSLTFVKGLFGISRMLQKLIPDKSINIIGEKTHQLSGKTIPIWFAEYPTYRSNKLKSITIEPNKDNYLSTKKIVYLPSCATKTMGTQAKSSDQRKLDEVILSLLKKADYHVVIPENINDICCGLPYHSKGYPQAELQKIKQLEETLLKSSDSGAIPILIDSSSCARQAFKNITNQIKILEPIQFALNYLIPNLSIEPLDETIMLHTTCSSQLMSLSKDLYSVAKICTKEVFIPEGINCCGFAGDKGFTLPELNQSALEGLKQQVPETCSRGFSTNLTCEIGLSHHSGIPYQSILYLLDEVSSPLLKEKQ